MAGGLHTWQPDHELREKQTKRVRPWSLGHSERSVRLGEGFCAYLVGGVVLHCPAQLSSCRASRP